MRYELPSNHGLTPALLGKTELMPVENGDPSLTDIQFEALEAGVARGRSLLISAPTSTGKTLIGWWAIAAALLAGKRAVYLVSHRALAKQKFEEVQSIFLRDFLDDDRSALICATGDSVEDAAGRKTNIPLSARILVATYEKYLGCLSVGGPPADLRDVCFVCDELQLVGDKHRGQNTELLLTLMRRSGWYQFVALSAVLSTRDATSLATWLNLTLVRNPVREKTIRLECRTTDTVHSVRYGPNFDGTLQADQKRSQLSTNGIIQELLADKERSPVIVFCMRVDDTYSLANSWASSRPNVNALSTPPDADIDDALFGLVQKRTAYHNAELTEEERTFIEDQILENKIDVVFATTTLAAGVNFPLGSAVFSAWERYNFAKRAKEPLDSAEFQNMAGRVGRMGQNASEGLVILTADSAYQVTQCKTLLNFSNEGELGVGIQPSDFGALTLQLFAGRLCRSREDAFQLVESTLTAARERERNLAGVEHWRSALYWNIDKLVAAGCLLESGSEIVVSTFGTAVAQSGLKPETATYFLDGLARTAVGLASKLDPQQPDFSEDDVLFCLVHSALASPEFSEEQGKPSRIANWRIKNNGAPLDNPYARNLAPNLFISPWNANAYASNGALLLAKWSAGSARTELSRSLDGIRLGTIQSTAKDVAWVLAGVAEIIQAVTSPALAEESKPLQLRANSLVAEAVRRLASPMRRHSARVSSGLPSDVLWMTELNLQGLRQKLKRKQMLSLRAKGLTRPIDVMDGGKANDTKRREALGSPSTANLVRNAASQWKASSRAHSKSIHMKRAAHVGMADIVAALYESRGNQLETAFENAMQHLSIVCQKLDHHDTQAFPDFAISIEQFPPIVVEIKSKQSESDLIALNAAMEVLAASQIAGYQQSFCITLCSPGVEPSVPAIIEASGRLAVVEIADLVEALLRLKEGALTRTAFQNWLTTPGIGLSETLPHH